MQKVLQPSKHSKQIYIVIAAYTNQDLIAGAFVAYDGRIRIGGDIVFLRSSNQTIETARLRVADCARAWAHKNAPGLPIRFIRAGEIRRAA